tara:strand:- start:269 stop:1441 length:1173 start_codon:yes stop_codon:yes gene_type:complete
VTPGARVQAAIEILDRILDGGAAERELTVWARGSRYAGSKDRAAVRDHVFDALRTLRSSAWIGGEAEIAPGIARSIMAGRLIGEDVDVKSIFNGQGHAPEPISPPVDLGPAPDAVRLDMPDWLLPILRADLGSAAEHVALALRTRAPVFLRANIARITRQDLLAKLSEEGVAAEPDAASPTAIRLTGTPRGLTALPSFRDGLWELQDAGSQALVDRVPASPDARILDLCAGGGGKALALAARGPGQVFAHDADPARMRDLPARTARAGARISQITAPEGAAPFDGVVADVPCSGSGSWRRAPDAKWRLTEARLTELTQTQDAILDRAIALTRPGGWIAYMTCSILARENADRAAAALSRHRNVAIRDQWSSLPVDGGHDGFHVCLLKRES